MTIGDIVSKTYFLTGTNSTSFPAATMLIEINNAYERVVSLILQADGRWQFDDNNFTSFPIATTTLVNSQPDYQFDTSHLKIERVEVLDKNGNYYKLEPIDLDDIDGSPSEFFETDGAPQYYDVQGGSLVLYPAPDNGVSVTLAAGLKVYFQRSGDLFTSGQVTTGTKVPGFNSLYHDLIAYWVAYNFAVAKGLSMANGFMAEIQRKEQSLQKDYSKRDKDDRPQITVRRISHR